MYVIEEEYIEELLRLLVERGLVRREGWRFFDQVEMTLDEDEVVSKFLGQDEDA